MSIIRDFAKVSPYLHALKVCTVQTSGGVSINLSPGHAHQIVKLISGKSTPTPICRPGRLLGSAPLS
jgi:hypothetical protein